MQAGCPDGFSLQSERHPLPIIAARADCVKPTKVNAEIRNMMNDDFRTLAIFIPRQIKHAFLKNNPGS